MTLEQDILKMLDGMRTVAVVCNQWGDTGKGKFVDLLTHIWADIVARGTGGANAGHTIRIGGKEYIFHLIPSGILVPGKTNIIGRGVAFDPGVVTEELEILDANNVLYSDRLMISRDAHLMLPQHIVMDRLKEGADGELKIGTTGRGIGPCYTDAVARIGLNVRHMLNPDLMHKKLKENLHDKLKILRTFDTEKVREVMHLPHLLGGAFYAGPQKIFDLDSIMEVYLDHGDSLRGMIRNAEEFIQQNLGRKNILLEGAQGLLLGIDYGTYPFVTSSDPSIRGLAKGVGISEKDVDLVLGIIKVFYMTRVGRGPFPTEMGGKESDVYCNLDGGNAHKVRFELEAWDIPYKVIDGKVKYNNYHPAILRLMNSENEFERGVGTRLASGEYGATTERPRRTGWLDLPLLRLAKKVNGPNMIMTKTDILRANEIKEGNIKICYAYEYQGPDYDLGDMVLRKGDRIDVAIPDADILQHCKPLYEGLPGWSENISYNIRRYDDLPSNAQAAIRYVEEKAGVNVRIVSVGAERQETVIRKVSQFGGK